MNRDDNLYIKINYIREEITNEMNKRRSQPIININNQQNSADGHMFFQEQKKDEVYYMQRDENEKIVDEEEQLKSKFLYNKTFVNNDK